MEKLLRVKASKFKGEQLNMVTLEDAIEQGYKNVVYSDIKVENGFVGVNFTMLVDEDIEVDYYESIISSKLSELFNGVERNNTYFTTNEGWVGIKLELNNYISDMEELLLSE